MQSPRRAIIREVRDDDEASWRQLWAGYLSFYEAAVSDDATSSTWRRMLDPASPLIGRIADADGRAAGFSISVMHEGTWSTAPLCYLEDLFVDPALRGAGIGHDLIQDLVERARSEGWSGLYWHTRRDNPARRLYDRFTPADDFVRYRLRM